MTAALDRRVLRLEAASLINADIVGVGSTRIDGITSADVRRFALAHDLPQHCCMWLVDGPDSVLLAPRRVDAIRDQDEAIWTKASVTYPHVGAVWDGEIVAAWRFDSEAESAAFLRSHDAQPERMLA